MQSHTNEEIIIPELFNLLPESVIWFRPVFDNSDDIIDFEVGYCNNAAMQFLDQPKEMILGHRLLETSVIDEEYKEVLFRQVLNVYKTGITVEDNFHNAFLEKYFSTIRSKVAGGVVSVSRDRTDFFTAEQERLIQTKKLTGIVDATSDGIIQLKAVRNTDNEIIDFNIDHCNKAVFLLSKIPANVVGKNFSEAFPYLLASDKYALLRQTLTTGEPIRFETNFCDEKGERYGWFIVSLVKQADSVVVTFTDISQQKRHEAKIKEQAELLNSILQSSINAIYAADAVRDREGKIVDLRILKVNEVFTKMTGRSPEEVEGKSGLSIFPTIKENGLFEKFCNVIETGKNLLTEVYYNGENIAGWHQISAVKSGDDGIVTTFADITDIKLSKEAIEANAEKLRQVINTSLAGMFTLIPVYDDACQIVDFTFGIVNQAVAAYIGETAEKLAGALGSIYFPAYKTNGLFETYIDTYLTGTEHSFDFHYQDGYDVFFNIHTLKTGNEVLVTFTDQTSLKRLQRQLEATIEDLKHSNTNLEEFAYAASHDLQEPLRKINYFSERLRNNLGHKLSAEELRMFERMESAAKRMSQLIEDLLSYSKVSRNTGKFEEVELSAIIQQVIADFEATIAEKSAVINAAPLPVINGNSLQLRQLFHNIISNSLKYSKPDTAPNICITCNEVTIEQNGDLKKYYQLDISDNGIGFEQEHSERIFKVFNRLHGHSEYPGTGIGLAIVNKVVENHKGIITAEGNVGKGARFTILLPVVEK